MYQKISPYLSFLLVFISFLSIGKGQKAIERFIQPELLDGVLDFLDRNGKKFLSITSLDTEDPDVTSTLYSLYRDSKLKTPHAIKKA